MNKKRVVKEPYSAYGFPASAEKGVAFIDFNKVLNLMVKKGYVKTTLKKRKVTKKRKQK